MVSCINRIYISKMNRNSFSFFDPNSLFEIFFFQLLRSSITYHQFHRKISKLIEFRVSITDYQISLPTEWFLWFVDHNVLANTIPNFLHENLDGNIRHIKGCCFNTES